MTRTTIPQRTVLLNLANGRPIYAGVYGVAVVRERIMGALLRKGLVDAKHNITAAGRAAVNTPERQP